MLRLVSRHEHTDTFTNTHSHTHIITTLPKTHHISMQRYCCICIMCTNILQTYNFLYDNLSTCKYTLF